MVRRLQLATVVVEAQPESRSTGKRLRHRLVRVLSVFAVVLSLLALFILLALHSPPARRFALNQVTSLLASQRIELQTDELRYNLFKLSIDLRNIRVRAAASPSAPIFATIGRAQLDLSLWQLLHGRYVVDAGAVDNVEIHYFVDEQGRDNLPRPLTDPNEPRKPLHYLIANLEVTDGRVRYEDRAQDIDVVLPFDSVKITGSALTDRHQIRAEGSAGQARFKNRSLAIDRLSGEVDLGDDDLKISRLDVTSIGSRADLAGSLTGFTAPKIAVRLKADVAAGPAAALLDVTETVAGRVTVDATATGSLASPAVDARVSGSALQFGSITGVQIDANTAYDPAAGTVEVSSARLQAPWGSGSATGHLALNAAHGSGVEAAVTGLDVATLMRALDLPYQAASRVDGTVQANWPGLDYLKAAGEVNATLRPETTRVGRSQLPVGGHLTARGNGSTIVATLQGITAAGAQVNGRIGIATARRLQGALRANVADLTRTVSAVEAFLGRPRGTLLPAQVTGPVVVDTRVSGTLDAPAAAAHVQAPALSVNRASGVGLDADLRVTPAALTVARADLNWQQANASLSGSVGLTGARLLNLVVGANAVDIAALLRAADQPSLPASGTLAARGTISGTVTRPLAALTVQGSDLVAYDETFGSLNADVALAGPEITLSRLSVDKPQEGADGRIGGTGSVQPRSAQLYRRSAVAERPPARTQAPRRSADSRHRGACRPWSRDRRLPRRPGERDGRQPGDRRPRHSAARRGHGRIGFAVGPCDHRGDGRERSGDAQGVGTALQYRRGCVDRAAAAMAGHGQGAGQRSRPRRAADRSRDAPHRPAACNRSRRTGNLDEPARSEATASIDAFAGSWNGQPFSVTSPSRLRYANERLDIERLQLAAGDSSLVVSGALPLTDRAGTGDIAIEGHANLATLAQYLPPGTNLTGDGAVTITGTTARHAEGDRSRSRR